ncbi:MAG: NAD-dependent epimerase/dehydratase family protein [Anaerolineae bacterium]|nr:NAD-dependent epimerase/dehydratase family protein [Anaerolineae bacterium]
MGGFIGSHLCDSLVKQGANVRAFVRYNSRGDWGLINSPHKEIEIVAGDLRDLDAVRRAMVGVSHVFHLGALIAIPYSYLHPAEVVETNIIGTMNVLLAGRDGDVERIIHTSTSEVYGTALRVPIDENHPLQGQSPYSASKIGADKLAESFFRSFNLPLVTLRPFNTYGPRQSARAVIPTIISQALTQPYIRLGNVAAMRDLTFVTDTVSGFLRVGEVDGVLGETFNLGTGQEVKIMDLANEIVSLLGKNLEIVIDPDRLRPENSEVQRLVSDNRLARERLNWSPGVSLRAGLAQTIAWISENINLYRPEVYQV